MLSRLRTDAMVRFRSQEERFFLLLALALFACVGNDLAAGIWRVHGGELFPWRHLPGVWLYPPAVLAVEWGLLLASASLLLTPRWRVAGVRLAAVVLFVSLLERFSNQRSLVFIILFYLLASPRKNLAAAFPAIRFQLLIVYLFSVVNKIDCAFWDGHTLGQLAAVTRGAILPAAIVQSLLRAPFGQPLACAVLAVEFLVPIFLMKVPRAGFALTALLHLGLSLCLPGLWPFSLAMVAMASLFVLPKKLES